jgi:hypothetical protein
MKRTLTLKRVSYGKQSTPVNKREYVAGVWGSPVGTKTEWRKWAKGKDFTLKFVEKPKTRVFIHQGAK